MGVGGSRKSVADAPSKQSQKKKREEDEKEEKPPLGGCKAPAVPSKGPGVQLRRQALDLRHQPPQTALS